jgi:hypothetical protein
VLFVAGVAVHGNVPFPSPIAGSKCLFFILVVIKIYGKNVTVSPHENTMHPQPHSRRIELLIDDIFIYVVI